jgi:hypothetical protein
MHGIPRPSETVMQAICRFRTNHGIRGNALARVRDPKRTIPLARGAHARPIRTCRIRYGLKGGAGGSMPYSIRAQQRSGWIPRPTTKVTRSHSGLGEGTEGRSSDQEAGRTVRKSFSSSSVGRALIRTCCELTDATDRGVEWVVLIVKWGQPKSELGEPPTDQDGQIDRFTTATSRARAVPIRLT